MNLSQGRTRNDDTYHCVGPLACPEIVSIRLTSVFCETLLSISDWQNTCNYLGKNNTSHKGGQQ